MHTVSIELDQPTNDMNYQSIVPALKKEDVSLVDDVDGSYDDINKSLVPHIWNLLLGHASCHKRAVDKTRTKNPSNTCCVLCVCVRVCVCV